MIYADMHMHSRCSDGSESIERLFELASAAAISVISITDHEIKPDLHRMKRASKEYKVAYIPGMEAAGIDKKSGLGAHILGYAIKDYQPVLELTTPVIKRRGANARKQIAILQRLGYDITEQEVRMVTESPDLYRQHINYILWKTGQIPDMFGTWYKQMYKNNGPLEMKNQYPEPVRLVEAIKKGGGYAVLAHCGQQKNEALIPALVRAGLDGLELNHPSNSIEYRKMIQQEAMKYSLFLTGGSDFHGLFSPNQTKIGACGVDWPINEITKGRLKEWIR